MPKPPVKTAAKDAVDKDTLTALDLLSVAAGLNVAVDLDMILKRIGDAAERLFDAEASSIMLLSRDGTSLSFKVASGDKAKILETMSVPVGKGVAGWVASTREPAVVNNARADEHFATEYDRASGYETRSLMCAPMICRGELIGVIEVLNRRSGGFEPEHIELLGKLASFAAGTIDNARTMAEQKGFFSHTLEVLAVATEATMPGMNGHLNRAATLARSIGRALGMGDYELKMLYYAGLLHDLGYVALNNPGYLRELGITKVSEELHPSLSVKLLQGITLIEDALPMILHHHERWDGTGYPHRLAGEAIPLGARILGLVEAVEEIRMTGLRGPDLYRKALAEVEASAGKGFSPQVVEAFKGLITARVTSW
ncbi:MAG: GAF domain-containing protein [Proteobacteria bacterium]|nr:GAF domain-containing protein [Pseudomonadota bacterium]